jgi:pyridoxine/pyridoxamine 5'-phosphate oxidase
MSNLKDADSRGWWFATSAIGAKGRQLANAAVAMIIEWAS